MAAIATADLRIRRAEPADYVAFAQSMSTPKAQAGTLPLPLPSLESWKERLAKTDPQAFVRRHGSSSKGRIAPMLCGTAPTSTRMRWRASIRIRR